MVTLAIVEHLDVVEGGVGQLDARLPLPSVEQLVLHARPERLHHRVDAPICQECLQAALRSAALARKSTMIRP